MNIELKNISFSERNSHETNCFAADIYMNGMKIGYCENQGCGGNTMVNAHPNFKKDFDFFVEYCRSLPSKHVILRNSKGEIVMEGDLKMDEENFCDELFKKWLNAKSVEKFNEGLQKDMLKGIVFADKPENFDSYRIINWKGVDLQTVIKNSPKQVKEKIENLKAQGKFILNTNLPKGFLLYGEEPTISSAVELKKSPKVGSKSETILHELKKNDGRKLSQIAKDLGVDPAMVSDVKKKYLMAA